MSTDVNRSVNGYGIAGFIISVIGVVMTFIKVNASFVDGWEWIVWAVWCVGAVLSTIGCFRRPRALAMAGLIISVIAVCVMWFVAEVAAPL